MTKDQELRLALEEIRTKSVCQTARTIAKDALRKALEQPEPEPVAWRFRFPHGKQWHYTEYGPHEQSRAELTWQNLYTSPPKREWQGLTGDERDTIVRMAGDLLDAICLTESKLEEKNT